MELSEAAILLKKERKGTCGRWSTRLLSLYSGSTIRGFAVCCSMSGSNLFPSNIDRLFALYQAQNPDAWLEPSNIGTNGNVFIDDDTTVDADTPLLPFRRTPDSFWTTNEARDTTVFGYAYPETRSSNSSAARAAVARLYSGSTRERLTAPIGSVKGHFMVGGERTFTDWAISTAADTRGLPPTFVVRFSLVGDFSSDPVTEVGMWSILMPMEHHKAEPGASLHQNASSRSTEGSVGMTASLLDEMSSGSLDSLEATDVVPFLKDRLTWSVHSVRRPCCGDSTIR
jgi:tyrosinase